MEQLNLRQICVAFYLIINLPPTFHFTVNYPQPVNEVTSLKQDLNVSLLPIIFNRV